MTQNSVFVILTVFGLLAIGGLAGYSLSQYDPSDSSEGMSDSDINEKLQRYAADLTTYGGKIVTHNNALTVPMGITVMWPMEIWSSYTAVQHTEYLMKGSHMC